MQSSNTLDSALGNKNIAALLILAEHNATIRSKITRQSAQYLYLFIHGLPAEVKASAGFLYPFQEESHGRRKESVPALP
nr:MAG TPA: hypothetical protein [Caudoviricetes sp.]